MKNRFSRLAFLSVIAILIGLTVVVFWVYLIGDIAIFRNLLKITPIYYVMLLAITLFFLFMRFLRWQFLLRRVGIRVPTRRSLSIYLASQLGIVPEAAARAQTGRGVAYVRLAAPVVTAPLTIA